jgi:nicotinate-nucleotide adenylyltransferase
MTERRIGILGGTFDPIHYGHLDVGEAAQHALGLTELFVMTANVPPHRREPGAAAADRHAMVVLAVKDRPGWHASDLELQVDTPSYTSDTLAKLRARGYRSTELFFVVGADAFAEVATWHDYPRILDAAHFAVVSRPGLSVDALPARLPQLASRMVRRPASPDSQRSIFLIDAITADVSATAIRARCEAGESIDGLVPPIVQQYIEQHGLYMPSVPGRRHDDTAAPPAAGRLHGKNGQAS